MITLQQAQTKPLVKASGKYGTVVFKQGGIENGKYVVGSQLANIKSGDLVGVITQTYSMPNGNNLAVVLLNVPVVSWFTQYTHGIIQLSDVDLIPIVKLGQMYYSLGNQVNIRKSPSLTALKFPTQLMKGDPIGTSDGVADINGWVKFNLAMGGVGYVKKEFITIQTPEKAIITQDVQTIDPMTGQSKTVSIPVVDVPSGTTDYLKIGKTAVISTIIGYILTKIIERFFSK